MIKRIFCLSLVFCQLLWSAAVMADQLDEAIRTAKNLRDVLRETFVPYLRSSTESMVKSNYLYMFWDHRSTQSALAERSHLGIARLSALTNDFDLSFADLGQDSPDWEAKAVHALALTSEIQGLKFDAERVRDNVQRLQSSWSHQCSAKSMARYADLFNPLSTYQLQSVGDAPAGLNPNIEFHVQISGSYGDNGGSVTGGSANTGKTDTTAGIGGIMITVGIALCCTSNPIGIIAGVIMIVLGALVSIFGMMEEACKEANKQGELAELKVQIRDTQLDGMAAVSAMMPQLVQSGCVESFPATLVEKLPLDIFSAYLNKTNEAYARVRSQRSVIFKQYADRLAGLAQNYYPSVEKNYLNLILAAFEQNKDIGTQVKVFASAQVAPKLAAVKTSRETTPAQLWESQQALWDVVIEGDARYRTRPGYSFVDFEAPEKGVPTFDNLWNDLGPKFGGVMK